MNENNTYSYRVVTYQLCFAVKCKVASANNKRTAICFSILISSVRFVASFALHTRACCTDGEEIIVNYVWRLVVMYS